ncbi:hypothetical protein GMRT_13778 [Giardia muris]|uniref:Uncharacterized protein n=1 Tax=Giardia muris TaxID=5742 RepID=A0A4Z1T8B3_GIAMU|nr:hypothetical protein GMRT_13778 [Giardia muris]|eukprot:TNJ28751.1 hypothetical protein GMRT_13778 [Giardia muris]
MALIHNFPVSHPHLRMRSIAFKQFAQTLPLLNLNQLAIGIQESFAQFVKDGMQIRGNQFTMHPTALYLFSQYLTSSIVHGLIDATILYNTVEYLSPVEREMSLTADNLISQRIHQYVAPDYPTILRMFKVMRLEVNQTNVSLASDAIVHDNPERIFYSYLKRNAELYRDAIIPLISTKYCKLLTREHVTRALKLSLSYDFRELNKEHFKVPILDPSENWVLISLFGLPYQYEVLQFVRFELLRGLSDKGVSITGFNTGGSFTQFLDQQEEKEININPPSFSSLPGSSNSTQPNVYGNPILIQLMEYWRHMVFMECIVSKRWLNEEKDLYEILPIPTSIDGINVELFGHDADVAFRYSQVQGK